MAELQQAASLCAEVVPRSGCGCTLCSKQVARCALSIRAAVLETYQYRCSKSADSRALSNTPRCFFIKFSVKENLMRTANRIVSVKSNLPVRLALCRGSAPLGAEVVPRSEQRYSPARCRGAAPLGVWLHTSLEVRWYTSLRVRWHTSFRVWLHTSFRVRWNTSHGVRWHTLHGVWLHTSLWV